MEALMKPRGGFAYGRIRQSLPLRLLTPLEAQQYVPINYSNFSSALRRSRYDDLFWPGVAAKTRQKREYRSWLVQHCRIDLNAIDTRR